MHVREPNHIRYVDAIHPHLGDIMRAAFHIGHFGPGIHAVNFGGANSPYFFEGNTSWELIPGEAPLPASQTKEA